MKPDEFLTLFTQQLKDMAPGAAAFNSEMQQQLRSAALAAFEKLELVTREEFDAQRAVLARTREKLEALEIEVEKLEKLIGSGK